MTLTLEKVGQAIGEYSSSLINYGLFLTGNEQKAQKLAYQALLHYIKIAEDDWGDRRVVLFSALREGALKTKKLKKVSELEKEVLFLQLCENFSRDEIKRVLNLNGEYWDLPYQQFLERIQRKAKIVSLDRAKAFFVVKHSKHKPHYLEENYRNLLIDYVCDYKVDLSAKGMAILATLMACIMICFHHYDKWRDAHAWNDIMAPMYENADEVKKWHRDIENLFFAEKVSPSNQLLTPLPGIQMPALTEQGQTCSLETQ